MQQFEALWRDATNIRHVQDLLDSYKSLLHMELVDRVGGPLEQSRAAFELPAILVSHGTQADPVFNYANRAALETFEMSWDEFTRTPSRFSAEPVERAERERLMSEVRSSGCIRNYRGIRISKTGRRFQIDDATVWNVFGSDGVLRGQAAVLFKWHYI